MIDMVHSLGLQRIEQARREIAAGEAARVRVVVDARKEEPDQDQTDDVRAARSSWPSLLPVRWP